MINSTDQRSLVNVTAALSWQPVDGDGLATSPGGAVTVTVQRANGTVLVTDQATGGAGSAPRTYTLPVAHTAITDVLTAVWKDATVERARTTVEILGGYYATPAAIRASDPTLANTAAYTDTAILRARLEVSDALSSLTACDFAPRFHRQHVRGTGSTSIVLDWGPIRTVRAVTVYYASSALTGTVWTAAQLAAIPADPGRIALCTDHNVWPAGADIVVEYESGYDSMPADLRDQFFVEVRKQLNDANSTSQIATQYNYDNDGQMADPAAAQTRRWFSTLRRYSLAIPGIG